MKYLIISILAILFISNGTACQAEEITYTVKSGDTLYIVAQQYNLSAKKVYSQNRSIIDSRNSVSSNERKFWIYPGQILNIKTEIQSITKSETVVIDTLKASAQEQVIVANNQDFTADHFSSINENQAVLIAASLLTFCIIIFWFISDSNDSLFNQELREYKLKLAYLPKSYLTPSAILIDHFLVCARARSNSYLVLNETELYDCPSINWLKIKLYFLRKRGEKKFIFIPPRRTSSILAKSNLRLRDIRMLNDQEMKAL